MSVESRLHDVRRRVAEACARSGRNREDVHMIAVTKYVSLATAQEALAAGCSRLGENRWQDAKAKWEAIGSAAEWHFIGTLQSNKVKDVVGRFPYIHSVDKLSLAQEISRKSVALGVETNVFLQVNVSGETSKHGLSPDQLFSLAAELRELPGVRVVGLMTMAPHEAEPEATRPVFRGLRELKDKLNEANLFGYEIPHLSMGMSNDFEIAIEEGATWVRLGTILVGKDQPD